MFSIFVYMEDLPERAAGRGCIVYHPCAEHKEIGEVYGMGYIVNLLFSAAVQCIFLFLVSCG
jgi:hypothetical protein